MSFNITVHGVGWEELSESVTADLARTVHRVLVENHGIMPDSVGIHSLGVRPPSGPAPEAVQRTIVYTAPGLDGEVRRTLAWNSTWSVDIARQYAAYHSEKEFGSVPCDMDDIEIIDIRSPTKGDKQ